MFIAGICSALVGTVLGATRASGREHLTVALLMIGKLDLSHHLLSTINPYGCFTETYEDRKLKEYALYILNAEFI